VIRTTFSAIAIVVFAVVFTVPTHAAPLGASRLEQGPHAGPPPVPHPAGPTHTSHGTPSGGGKAGGTHAAMTPSQHLQHSPQLARKLTGLLPPGTNLETAAADFKNFGQFVAAVHVSHNLGIPFQELKALMIAPKNESLGQAVKSLKPGASNEAVKEAENEAKADLKEADAEQKAEQAKARSTQAKRKATDKK
jgi:hypothetical protein